VGGGGTGSYTFLTAAEQREQGKKDEKKAAESPYSFLLNVKDVCRIACVAKGLIVD
jgi:DNA mismatch repair protein MSH6